MIRSVNLDHFDQDSQLDPMAEMSTYLEAL